MQDWLRRMRLRKELLNELSEDGGENTERDDSKEKEIGTILLPQNRRLIPPVRNHTTPPMKPSASDAEQTQVGENGSPSRSARIAKQLGEFYDGHQKYLHPVEYAKRQAKDKLHEKFMSKMHEKLGAEKMEKLQNYARAYSKYRHPI